MRLALGVWRSAFPFVRINKQNENEHNTIGLFMLSKRFVSLYKGAGLGLLVLTLPGTEFGYAGGRTEPDERELVPTGNPQMKTRAFVFTLLAIGVLSAVPADAQQKEITVWSWFVASTMQKSIKAFEAKHPDLKVNYTYYNYSPQYLTALKAAAASNSLPDIIGLQPGSFTQQYREQLAPLNSYAAKEWGDNWTSQVFPVALKQLTMGNPPNDTNYYLLPQECQVLCIWYNKPVFQKLGLSVPKTYAELVEVAKKLTSGGYIPLYQGAADGWQNENVFLMIANQLVPGLAEKAQAGQAPWTSPELVSALEAWSALFKDHVFQEGALGARAYPTGAQLFAQGRIGMMALGSWWMQESKFPPPLSQFVQNMNGFDFFYFPALKEGGQISPPVGGVDIGYGLTKNGEKNPEAWKFLASLVKGEALQEALNDLNDLPSFTGFEPQGDITPNIKEMYNRFIADLPHAENQRIAHPEIGQELDNVLAGVASGTVTPADGLKRVQDVTDKTLK
jgi:raffinose/stachyose/melibiose transport system substrate-binding protein